MRPFASRSLMPQTGAAHCRRSSTSLTTSKKLRVATHLLTFGGRPLTLSASHVREAVSGTGPTALPHADDRPMVVALEDLIELVVIDATVHGLALWSAAADDLDEVGADDPF